MRHAKRTGIIAALWLTVMASGTALAGNGTAIAHVKTVSGAAFVVRDGNRKPANLGDELFEKDMLQTGAGGTIGVTFTDDSVLSLGPNSEAALTEYSFDSSNFKGTMLTDMRKGTLSMVSGGIARSSPDAMKVRTPAAILGVRGTSFVVEVGKD
jgi:hypothetical protein